MTSTNNLCVPGHGAFVLETLIKVHPVALENREGKDWIHYYLIQPSSNRRKMKNWKLLSF